MSRKLNVVSLFSGGGGLDLGLAAAGFSILFENDIDVPSCKTLEMNASRAASYGLAGFENTVTCVGDIRNIDGSDILMTIGCDRGEVDLLAGGPPCQAFSVFGKRKGTEDQRGLLSFEYKRVLGEIAPKVFVFENVAGILTVEGGAVYELLLEELATPADDLSYSLFANRVDAHDFFVPQNRDRVIIVGVRRDIVEARNVEAVTIKKTCSNKDDELPGWRTVADAFRGIPELRPNAPASTEIANHHGRRHSQDIIRRYEGLAPGERDPKTRINKLDLNRPSYTIVVGSDKGGGKGHVHPTMGREVSPRESARLQTFPDWWEFAGSVRDEIRQVGNAVPCLLGFSIGNAIRVDIFGLPEVSLETGVHRLGQGHLLREG